MEELFRLEAEGFSEEGALQGACEYTGVAPKFLKKFQMTNVTLPSWVKTA